MSKPQTLPNDAVWLGVPLPKSCATCNHYDGDGYCALPRADRLLAGYIYQAAGVVCARHEVKE